MNKRLIKLIVIIAIGALFITCVKKQDPAAFENPQQDLPKEPAQGGDRIVLEPAAGGRQNNPPPGGSSQVTPRAAPAPKTAPVVRVQSGGEWLFVPFLGEPILPEDMEIGPLQDLTMENQEKMIIQILDRFFTGLIKGKLEESSLDPESRDSIKRSLSFHIQKGDLPKKVRYGRIILKEDTAKINTRLLGDKGRTTGTVYLKNKDGKWFILDLQADYSVLEVPYKRDSLFNPGEYSWIGQ